MPEAQPKSQGSGTRTYNCGSRFANTNGTMELLSRVLGAGNEDPDLPALSAALKTKLKLSDSRAPTYYVFRC